MGTVYCWRLQTKEYEFVHWLSFHVQRPFLPPFHKWAQSSPFESFGSFTAQLVQLPLWPPSHSHAPSTVRSLKPIHTSFTPKSCIRSVTAAWSIAEWIPASDLPAEVHLRADFEEELSAAEGDSLAVDAVILELE